MVMVWRWWYIDPRIKTWLWEGKWGGMCMGMELKLDYTYIYHIDAWWKLELSGLWGECCVCDLGVWRVRVVLTKLEYTMSLGQVLPWGATWAPLEMDTCGG